MTGLPVSRHPRDLVLVIENFPPPIAAIRPIELISTRPRFFWRKVRAMKVIRNLVFIPFGLIIGLTVDGFEQPRHAGTTMAAIHVATAWGGTTESERVPFVGCETIDLGGGDEEAPKDRGQAPVLPRPVAHKLVYYASAELGVLAPRGWHCHGYTRTEGSSLVVTPEPLSADSDRNPNGPGIVLLSYH